MSTTLYRKYRPQRFSDLVGQRHVQVTLLAELEGQRVAHAYLLVGPRGVGKTTTARLLAKAVNCERPKGVEPCNTCASCTSMNDGRSLDLIEIDAASHTQVDHVRENILPAVRTAPIQGKFKVFIIDEVHMLSVSAFNALLKTLEEPPAHVIFILATTEVHRVPATIVSRCQRFDFRRVPITDTVGRLQHIAHAEGVKVPTGVLERIAAAAGGSLRDAEGMLGQLFGLGGEELTEEQADLILPRSNASSVLELLEHLVHHRLPAALQLIQRLADDGVRFDHFLRECIEMCRQLMLLSLQLEPETSLLTEALRKQAEQISRSITPDGMVRYLDVFQRREREVKFASLPQLPVELAAVELSSLKAPPSSPTASTRRGEGTPLDTGIPGSSGLTAKKYDRLPGDWSQVIKRVRAENPSLAVLLKNLEPRGMVNGTVVLVSRYAFHLERLRERKNQAAIEEAIGSVFGMSVRVSYELEAPVNELVSAPVTEGQSASDVWQEALRVFGASGEGRATSV